MLPLSQLCSGARDWRKGSGVLNLTWFPSRLFHYEGVSLVLKLARDMKSSQLASSLLEAKFTLIVEDFLFDGSVSEAC